MTMVAAFCGLPEVHASGIGELQWCASSVLARLVLFYLRRHLCCLTFSRCYSEPLVDQIGHLVASRLLDLPRDIQGLFPQLS